MKFLAGNTSPGWEISVKVDVLLRYFANLSSRQEPVKQF